ncbi:MAG: superoxide dismutase [Hyphomicrobium sp.]
MKFELPPLPYAKDALEPHMGRETLEYHYEKHHRGYLKKLQGLIQGTPRAEQSLEDIIRTADGSVFNNAAQVWNHTFFWNCMEPNGGGEPSGDLAHLIRDSFGSFLEFKAQFVATGKGRFGSGYVWLVLDNSVLRCIATLNADNLLLGRQTPLLTCDLWEHAYYLDHRNDRGKYLDVFLRYLVNWDFVAQQLKQARRGLPISSNRTASTLLPTPTTPG